MAANTPLIEDYIPVIKYHGLNTDKAVDLGSTLNVDGAVTFGSTLAITSTLDVTGVTTVAELKSKRNVLASSGNTSPAAALSGSVLLMDSATVDFTLPAIAAAQVGVFFDFFVTVTSTNQSITAASGDLLIGSMTFMDAATPLFDVFTPDVTDDLIFSTNGTTTGGLIGSCYRFTAISATRWWVSGFNLGSGTAATPFS